MVLESLNVTQADGYLRRGDFSRWIATSSAIMPLARELQGHERRRERGEREALDQIVAAIRSRNDLTDESDVATVHESGSAET